MLLSSRFILHPFVGFVVYVYSVVAYNLIIEIHLLPYHLILEIAPFFSIKGCITIGFILTAEDTGDEQDGIHLPSLKNTFPIY